MKTFRKIGLTLAVMGGSLFGLSGVAHAQNDSTYRWGSYSPGNGVVADESPTPMSVAANDIAALAAGNASDMALTSSGQVEVWGTNAHGVLGLGSAVNYEANATIVPNLPTIAAIGEADDTDIAITTTGTVYGWGWNQMGELCQGNEKTYQRPVLLSALTGITEAAGGQGHMLYLQSNGNLEACGQNKFGELGDGTTTGRENPVNVIDLPPSPIAAISAGRTVSSILTKNGQIWMWGDNNFGELGIDSSASISKVPVRVPLETTAVEVYSGGDLETDGQTLALLSDGTVYGWGNNAWGQLGNGSTTNSDVPVQATALPSGHTWVSVASGGSTSYALDSNGNVYGFGNDDEGQVGDGGTNGYVTTPALVLTGADMISTTASDAEAHTP